MSQRETVWRSVTDMPRALGVRGLLKWSAVAGAALGATMFSNQSTALNQQGQSTVQDQQRQRNFDLMKTLPVAHRRRVVTANNAQGKSYIVSDEVIPDNSGGIVGSSRELLADGKPIPGHMDLWATDPSQPVGPGPSSEIVGTENLLPKKGSTRAYFATLPAGYNSTATRENRIGMHRTLTIDYVYVLSGEVTMLMEIGEVKLKAGDVVIQRNTDHSWIVDGKTPVTLLAFLARIEK